MACRLMQQVKNYGCSQQFLSMTHSSLPTSTTPGAPSAEDTWSVSWCTDGRAQIESTRAGIHAPGHWSAATLRASNSIGMGMTLETTHPCSLTSSSGTYPLLSRLEQVEGMRAHIALAINQGLPLGCIAATSDDVSVVCWRLVGSAGELTVPLDRLHWPYLDNNHNHLFSCLLTSLKSLCVVSQANHT